MDALGTQPTCKQSQQLEKRGNYSAPSLRGRLTQCWGKAYSVLLRTPWALDLRHWFSPPKRSPLRPVCLHPVRSHLVGQNSLQDRSPSFRSFGSVPESWTITWYLESRCDIIFIFLFIHPSIHSSTHSSLHSSIHHPSILFIHLLLDIKVTFMSCSIFFFFNSQLCCLVSGVFMSSSGVSQIFTQGF